LSSEKRKKTGALRAKTTVDQGSSQEESKESSYRGKRGVYLVIKRGKDQEEHLFGEKGPVMRSAAEGQEVLTEGRRKRCTRGKKEFFMKEEGRRMGTEPTPEEGSGGKEKNTRSSRRGKGREPSRGKERLVQPGFPGGLRKYLFCR